MNEIDVLLLSGNDLTFFSCNSGNMRVQQALHTLFELQTVTEEFGGKYAKKILVPV